MHEAIKPGSQLYRVFNDNRAGRAEHVVVKGMGPKWITIDGPRGERFDKATLRSESGRSRLYLSKDIHDAEVARREAWQKLRYVVMSVNVPSDELPTESILQAITLLSPETKEPTNG